ncbi:soluble NSF attachment protein [Trichoderma velutinum]
MDNPKNLVQQAEDLLTKGSGWRLFSGLREKSHDAVELFKDAAQAYQLQREEFRAGKTYERAAEMEEKREEFLDAYNTYVEASKAYQSHFKSMNMSKDYKKPVIPAAIHCQEKAITMIKKSTSENKKSTLSRINEAIGTMYEKDYVKELKLLNERRSPVDNSEEAELEALEKARIAYKEAADWIRAERELNSNTLLTQHADLTARIATTMPYPAEKGNRKFGYYEDAIKAYIIIIESMQSNSKLIHSLPPYYFKVCICRLAQCNEEFDVEREIQKYQQIDNGIISQHKYKLLYALHEAICERDKLKFATLVAEFNPTDSLDKSILYDIPNSIKDPCDFS